MPLSSGSRDPSGCDSPTTTSSSSPASVLFALLQEPSAFTIQDSMTWPIPASTPAVSADSVFCENNIMQSIIHSSLTPLPLSLLSTDATASSSALTSSRTVTPSSDAAELNLSNIEMNPMVVAHSTSEARWVQHSPIYHHTVSPSPVTKALDIKGTSLPSDHQRRHSSALPLVHLPISTAKYAWSDSIDFSERTNDAGVCIDGPFSGLANASVKSEPPLCLPTKISSQPEASPVTASSKTRSSCPNVAPHRKCHCTFSGCNRWFTRKNNLDAHYRTHTGERPAVCTECKKTFNRKHDLSRHISSVHSKSDRYGPCLKCGARFPRQDAFKRHMYTCSRQPE
ncbi:hypothetical protein BSLG_010094 [Batrachochytrium salamandrivorans]|nr:hypothetical protein BSLG_010094 [Batrachochytrium salamandrivorans]